MVVRGQFWEQWRLSLYNSKFGVKSRESRVVTTPCISDASLRKKRELGSLWVGASVGLSG